MPLYAPICKGGRGLPSNQPSFATPNACFVLDLFRGCIDLMKSVPF